MDVQTVIRGTGLVTPLGVGVESTWRSLLAGDFITGHSRCPLEPLANADAHLPRVGRLARLAVREALVSADWSRDMVGDDRTALVIATSRGPADDWLQEHTATLSGGNAFEPTTAAAGRGPSFGISELAAFIAADIGHQFGPRLSICGACASGLHGLIRAAMLIAHGDADRAIVVAAESSLHPLFLQSLKRLGVAAPEGARCRPFDANRQGMLVSEAAAAVVLERAGQVRADDLLIDRYAFAGDGGHLTGFDPNAETLRRLLGFALDGRPVDLVHAHGTGTVTNDANEASAIDAAVAAGRGRQTKLPAVYSHKGAIGHTLGAAGLIGVVLNAQMHALNTVLPNAGLESPIAFENASINSQAIHRPIGRSAACAAGFGGAMAAMSFVKAEAR